MNKYKINVTKDELCHLIGVLLDHKILLKDNGHLQEIISEKYTEKYEKNIPESIKYKFTKQMETTLDIINKLNLIIEQDFINQTFDENGNLI